MVQRRSDGTNELFQVRFLLQEGAKVANLVPRRDPRRCDHATETAGAEVTTCEGEAPKCREVVSRVADDPLDDFPRQIVVHRESSGRG